MTIRQIIEGEWAKILEAKLHFVDFTKAFNSILGRKKNRIICIWTPKRNCLHYGKALLSRWWLRLLHCLLCLPKRHICRTYYSVAISHLLKMMLVYAYRKHQQVAYIYKHPPTSRIWHQVNLFKWSATDLKSEFSFS